MPSKSVKIESPVTGHDAIICFKLLKKFFNSLLSVLMRNSPEKLVKRFKKIVSITNVRGLASCASFVEFSLSFCH